MSNDRTYKLFWNLWSVFIAKINSGLKSKLIHFYGKSACALSIHYKPANEYKLQFDENVRSEAWKAKTRGELSFTPLYSIYLSHVLHSLSKYIHTYIHITMHISLFFSHLRSQYVCDEQSSIVIGKNKYSMFSVTMMLVNEWHVCRSKFNWTYMYWIVALEMCKFISKLVNFCFHFEWFSSSKKKLKEKKRFSLMKNEIISNENFIAQTPNLHANAFITQMV